MLCDEAVILLENYAAALSAVCRAEALILTSVTPDHWEYENVLQVREHALEALIEARHLYWKHVASHRCRTSGIRRAAVGPIARAKTDGQSVSMALSGQAVGRRQQRSHFSPY